MARLIPAQMSKWYNTTYGFIMGIAAAALTISVISAATAGVVIGGMAFIVYVGSHMNANACMERTMRINNSLPKNKDKYVGISLEQANECRKKNSLSTLTLEDVREGSLYPEYLPWAHEGAHAMKKPN